MNYRNTVCQLQYILKSSRNTGVGVVGRLVETAIIAGAHFRTWLPIGLQDACRQVKETMPESGRFLGGTFGNPKPCLQYLL